MLTEKIRAWLDGSQNFIVGRVLYKQLGNDENIKAQLQKGEHAGTKKLLKEALEALLEKPVIVVPKVNPVVSQMPPHADPVLNALTNEWKPLYARMNYLRAAIDQWGERNDPEAIAAREPMAFEILQLEDCCQTIWNKRDHYLKSGSLPGNEETTIELPSDPLKLARLIDSIKRNITRNRAKMSKPGADALYAQLYVQYKEKYKTITGKDYEEKN